MDYNDSITSEQYSSYIFTNLGRLIDSTYIEYFELFLIVCIVILSIIVSLFGTKYALLSFITLLAIIVDSILPNIFMKIKDMVDNGQMKENSITMEIVHKYAQRIINFEKSNPFYVVLGILIFSFLTVHIIFWFQQNLFFIGLVVIAIFLYDGILGHNYKDTFGDNNKVVSVVGFIIVMVFIYFLLKKILMLVLAFFFGTAGPFVAVSSMEFYLVKDWGFGCLRKNYQKTDLFSKNGKIYIVFLLTCLLCVMFQVTFIIKGKN